MCIPCFPFSDIEFEDEPRQKKGVVYQYVWNGQNWVLQPYSHRRRNVSSFSPVLSTVVQLHLKLSRPRSRSLAFIQSCRVCALVSCKNDHIAAFP